MSINIEDDAEEYNEVAQGKYRGSLMIGNNEENFVKRMYELL